MTLEEATDIVDEYHSDMIIIVDMAENRIHYGIPTNVVIRQDLGSPQLVMRVKNYNQHLDLHCIKLIRALDCDLGL